jgi:hypothetical protein
VDGNVQVNEAISCGNINAQGITCAGDCSVNGNVNDQGNITGASLTANGDISADGNIYTSGDIHANGNIAAQSFSTTSDRNLKEKFTSIDNQEILGRVASLPISRWNFTNAPAVRHIGPMAQDFYAAFNVGTDDKHIATVDEGGVALAAIQGLNQKLNEKDGEIQALKQSVADLKRLVQSLAEKK